MRIDHAERFVFFLQVLKDRHQRDMLDDVGKVSRVIGVPVVHDFLARRGRGSNSPPQFGQRPFTASVQDVQKVHSKEQMRASPPSEANGVAHFSHLSRISSAMIAPRLRIQDSFVTRISLS
jgi:hypothetical protein